MQSNLEKKKCFHSEQQEVTFFFVGPSEKSSIVPFAESLYGSGAHIEQLCKCCQIIHYCRPQGKAELLHTQTLKWWCPGIRTINWVVLRGKGKLKCREAEASRLACLLMQTDRC